MTNVETLPNINGNDKKHVAMLILQNVMTNIAIGNQFATIKDIVADTIDVIVSASKGTLDINKATACCTSCFGLCTFGASTSPASGGVRKVDDLEISLYIRNSEIFIN